MSYGPRAWFYIRDPAVSPHIQFRATCCWSYLSEVLADLVEVGRHAWIRAVTRNSDSTMIRTAGIQAEHRIASGKSARWRAYAQPDAVAREVIEPKHVSMTTRRCHPDHATGQSAITLPC
jgi:hypothetical protein